MSTATMHFGPEWMRTKNQPPSRSQQQPSPPPANALLQAPTLATYSALVSVTPLVSGKLDESHPFRYSKEELLAIYQEGGGKGGLGLEVDRWQGVVREVVAEPVTLREMTDAEKKLFAGSLNSEIRRRPSQSADHFSPLNTSVSERPRMMPCGSVAGSRERFGGMKRKDSAGGTADSTSMPRKPSLSTLQVPGVLAAASPRTRIGYNSNFDGVFNNGESWIARRRFSEASLKVPNPSSTEIQVENSASKQKGIAEVKEEVSATAVHVCKEDGTYFSPTSAGINSVPASQNKISVAKDTADNITGTTSVPTTYRDYQETGHSPAILDLTAIEWSYKDPTGQVQGPFRADLMQKWYEEGYFTPNLPMKRTHLDSQWFTVQELVTQAAGASVFLMSPLPAGPPGLNRQSSLQTSEHCYKEPFQPAPIRSLRTSSLESSLTGVSLTSDSPSSLGAPQLGESSPEASAFIGRDKRQYGSIETDGRKPGFGLQDMSTPGFLSTRLNGNGFVHDLSTTFERRSSGNFVPDLDVGLNGHVFNNHPAIVHDSRTAFPNSFGIPNANLTTPHGIQTKLFNEGVATGYGFELGRPNHSHFGGPQSGTIFSTPVDYTPSHELAGTIPFTGLVSQQPYAAQIPNFGHNQLLGQTSGPRIQENVVPHVSAIHSGLPSGQSPWGIVPDPRIHASLAVEGLEPATLHVSGGLSDVTIRDTLLDEASANRFDVEVDDHHTAPQELLQPIDEKMAVEQDSRTAFPSNTTSDVSSASEKGKLSTKASKPLDQNTLSDNPVAQVPAKSAWTKDDAVKGKSVTASSVSLRQIQEAEAKKQQILKAIEREKERTRAALPSEVKEDAHSFTASWGLLTSQLGGRSNMYLPAKDVPTPTATNQPSVSAVWTTTTTTPMVKKSMKEIQEEEEKRKRQAARDNSVSVTPKRAHVESSSKTTPSPISPASNTSPWATVGPNGKPLFPTQPSRTPTAVSGPSAVSRGTATLNQRIVTTPPMKTRPVTKPEVPEAPSHEFLKWLGESLKGVNTSANVEEIMSMLFSFPLDPDSSTLEIISDTIYANSTTLDGRRFAADFVAKRKADAASRCKAPADSGRVSASNPVSIADVVKAVPKSTQPEWGFKVVNKRKKGGRS